MNRHVASPKSRSDTAPIAGVRRLQTHCLTDKVDRCRGAFSLVELLIVIVLTSILAQLAISAATPTVYDQLNSTANIIAGEMAYARSLAVGNNGSYRFDVDTANNRLVMRYTGADSSLATLPFSPYRSTTDPPDQYIVALANLPRLGMPASLLGGAVSRHNDSVDHIDRVWSLWQHDAIQPIGHLADCGGERRAKVYFSHRQPGDRARFTGGIYQCCSCGIDDSIAVKTHLQIQ